MTTHALLNHVALPPSAQPMATGHAGGTSAFDFNALRLDQSFAGDLEVVRELTRIPVGKPGKLTFFRAHPDSTYTFDTLVLQLKEAGETYIAAPRVSSIIPELLRPVRLHLAVDTQGNPQLVPLPLPDATGKWNPWHQSLHQALELAKSKWVRISANMAAGSYDVFSALKKADDPLWPEQSMHELLDIAFKDRIIDTAEHPVIEQLLGMV